MKVYIVHGTEYHDDGAILGVYATVPEALDRKRSEKKRWHIVLIWEWLIGSDKPTRVSADNPYRGDTPRVEEWA